MKEDAFRQVVRLSDEVRNMAITRYQSIEEYKFGGLERRKTQEKTVTVKDLEFAQMSTNLFENIGSRAKLFLVSYILPGIKKYNLLWHKAPSRNKAGKLAIQELVQEKILFRTETPGMYIVNPVKIWRGTIPSAVEATKNLLREHRKPTPELVHDLRPRDMYLDVSEEVNQRGYKALTDGFTTNLLEEDEAEYKIMPE